MIKAFGWFMLGFVGSVVFGLEAMLAFIVAFYVIYVLFKLTQ